MLAAGNTVVFNAHPSGANIAAEGVRRFNRAIRDAIGLDDLLTIIDPPTIESAEALFKHRGVKLLVVTGGPAVARAALASNKRAIVAGPGNPPVVVDGTACLDNAAKSIVMGAAFDNNLLCIGEKQVFATADIFDKLMDAVGRNGGFRLEPQPDRRPDPRRLQGRRRRQAARQQGPRRQGPRRPRRLRRGLDPRRHADPLRRDGLRPPVRRPGADDAVRPVRPRAERRPGDRAGEAVGARLRPHRRSSTAATPA